MLENDKCNGLSHLSLCLITFRFSGTRLVALTVGKMPTPKSLVSNRGMKALSFPRKKGNLLLKSSGFKCFKRIA